MKKLLLSILSLVACFVIATAQEKTVTFDFVNNDYGLTRESGTSQNYLDDGTTVAQEPVTITLSKDEGTNGMRLWTDGLRFFKNSNAAFTVSVPEGYIIKSIVLDYVSGAGFELGVGEAGAYADKTWTGEAASVKLCYTPTKAYALKTLAVTYTEPAVVTPPVPAAANMAIQKTVRTSTTVDYRVIVPWEVAGHGSYADSHNAQDSYSVGMWFRPTGTHYRDGGLLMSHATNNHCNKNGLWFIWLNSTGAITIGAASGDNLNGATTGLDGTSAGSVTMNEWHYMLFSVDNVNLTASVYIDGEKTMSKTLEAPLFYKWGDGVFHFASNGFGGELDQAEIYSTGLTDAEAAQAYVDPTKVASVRAVYTFDEIAEGTTSQFANTLGFGATENAVFQKYTGWADWGNGPVDTGSTGTNHSEVEYAPTLVDGREITVTPVTYALTVEANGCEYTLTDSESGAAIEDFTAIAENTGLTLSITSVPEGKVLSSVMLGETALEANEDGVYTFTVTSDATLTIAVEDAPVPEYTVTYAGEHGHMMYQGEEGFLEVPAEGFKMAEGSSITVQLVVDEGYELKSMTLNDADVTANFAMGYYTIENISADQSFVAVISEAKVPSFEYTAPGGTTSPDSYLTGITSTGAVEDITYTSSSHPGIYTVLDQAVSAQAGSEFSLEFIANSLGEGSHSEVYQDLRFCAAYIFADWYGNGEFTMLDMYGKVIPEDNIYGNYDEVMDITRAFTVPADVKAGKAARIRIIYADAWSKPGATSSAKTETPDANSQYIDKGIAYDIVVNIVNPVAVTYALTVEANGCEYTLTDSESGAAIEDLTAIAENTGLTLSITSVPEGKVLSSVMLGETALEANEDGVYTFTVTSDATLTIAVEDAPVTEYTVTYTGEHGHMMYQGEEAFLEVPAEGFKMAEGSSITVQLVVDEGYELKSMTLNDADVTESFAMGYYTIENISADQSFVAVISEAKVPGYEYMAPSGTTSPASYLTGIVSDGAVEDITYTSSSHPGIYTVLDQEVSARAGSEFSLEFIANSLGEGSMTSVRQDLRFCAAYIFADWYGNGEFTMLDMYGKVTPEHYIYGNYDEVMDITHTFTVPADVEVGTPARIRIIYADAWSKPGATGKGQSETPDANSQYIDKGIAYDIVVNTLPGVYAVTYEAPENGTLAVMLGETPLVSGSEVEGGTEVTVTATPAAGYVLETLTANGEAIEAGAYTVNGDVAFAATFVEAPGNSILVPAATFADYNDIYSFRFDDAPLGEHTNGTNTEETDHRSRNFTYSAWINIKDGAEGKPVMSNIQSPMVGACAAFQVKYKDGKLTLNGRDALAIQDYNNVDGSATLDEGTPLNEWVFVSVVADQENKKVTLYKNCQEISSFATTYGVGLLHDESSFAISDEGAPVAVAEVQLWNKALTLDELKASYNLEETPEALVAYYKATEMVEGSATDLRNLGSEGTTTAKLIKGNYYKKWGMTPVWDKQEAQPIELTGEARQLKSVSVTVNQPEIEGNTVALTGFKGREITDQANLFERINVVPTLAEGVELGGVKVLEANGTEKVYTLEQLPFFANDDITVSFLFSNKYLVKATVTNGSAKISVDEGELEDLPEAGKEVENGSKVVVYFFPPADNAEKYSLTAFTVNGEDRLADMVQNVYAINAIDADYTFEATFSLPQHHLSVVNPDGEPAESFYGEFRTSGNVRFEYDDAEGLDVDEGTSVVFVVMPPEQEREGYTTTLKAVKDNDTDVTESLMELEPNGEQFYMMGAITEDHVLSVSQDVTGIIAISADADNALSFADGKLIVAEDAVIEVVDINGRLVARAEGTALAVDDLVKGVYVAKAVTADAVYTLKFIKL